MARGKSRRRDTVKKSSEKSTSVQKKEIEPFKLQVKRLAGSSLIEYKPLFSHDSKFLFVISEKHVKVFSTVSGKCFRTLIGHDSPVISLQRNPTNCFQIFSCSRDGTVIKWNYEDGTKLKAFKLNCVSAVRCFYVVGSRWFVVPEEKIDEMHNLFAVNAVGNKFKKQFVMKPVLGDGKDIAFGREGNLVCSVYENKLRVFYTVDEIRKMHLTNSKMICVACHPTDDMIATGDETGRILVWTNFLTTNKPSHSVYHWHALPLADLTFTAEGSYLFSGGEECVLVKWRLGTQDRQFLPRMGLPIRYVTTSTDNSYVATSHADNAIQLVGPQNRVVNVLQGFTRSESQDRVGIIYDPGSSALVTNGRPGHLQFYHLGEDKQLFNLDVVGQNYTTGTSKDGVMHHTEVEKAAFNGDGSWLATAEYRDDGETSVEIRLKFWRYDKSSQTFNLNTNIFLAHNKRIIALKFKPQSEEFEDVPVLMTTGQDQKFKVWTLRDKETSDGESRSVWACHSMGYYHCLPAGNFDFSEDGSLAGVAFGHALTLWTVGMTSLRSALVCQNSSENIRQVAFGRGSCCHLVVSATASSLTVWNLLSLTVSWTVETNVIHLIVDPFTKIMAAFTTDQTLFAFGPENPSPVYIHPAISSWPVRTAAFIPSSRPPVRESSELPWSPRSQLVFVDSRGELMTLTDRTEEEEAILEESLENRPKTPFGLLMAQHRKSSIADDGSKDRHHLSQGVLGLKELNEILNVPSHVLPSISAICGSFMSSLLIGAEPKREDSKLPMCKETEDEKMEEDDGVEDTRHLRLESYDWLTDYLKTHI